MENKEKKTVPSQEEWNFMNHIEASRRAIEKARLVLRDSSEVTLTEEQRRTFDTWLASARKLDKDLAWEYIQRNSKYRFASPNS
jgi:hypothetical protein